MTIISASQEAWRLICEPWAGGIMQRALAEATLLSIVGGVLGCWIILYEISYSAESLAHALFPGLVIAVLVGFPLVLGAGIGVTVAALLIASFGRAPGIGRDMAVAVVISALFGAGIVLALSPRSPPGIQELLFGDILGVSDLDLLLAAGLSAVTLLALRLLHRQLLVVGFDRMSARSVGGNPRLVDTALLVLVALATLIAVQGLGNLLVVAMLVGPAATARLLTKRIMPMMALAVLVASAASVSGLYLSYYVGTAGGASVAGCIIVLYLLALVGNSIGRRLLTRRNSGEPLNFRSSEPAQPPIQQ